jgi:hypothetical protein
LTVKDIKRWSAATRCTGFIAQTDFSFTMPMRPRVQQTSRDRHRDRVFVSGRATPQCLAGLDKEMRAVMSR